MLSPVYTPLRAREVRAAKKFDSDFYCLGEETTFARRFFGLRTKLNFVQLSAISRARSYSDWLFKNEGRVMTSIYPNQTSSHEIPFCPIRVYIHMYHHLSP